MKNNQLEVIRHSRWVALNFQGVKFTTIHLDAYKYGFDSGSITVAYKKIVPEEGSSEFRNSQNGWTYYRVQFAFCSPCEKNPSKIFGEGLASLRWNNDKSAIRLIVPPNGQFIDYIRRMALAVAVMKNVSWLKDKRLQDLV